MRIGYILSLPSGHGLVRTQNILERLRQFCMDQPFQKVGSITVEERPARSGVFRLDPLLRVGFQCRCCPAPNSVLDLFLYRFPRHRGVSIPWAHQAVCDLDGNDPMYPARHAAIINVLAQAHILGIGVEVNDPSNFWRMRSKRRLEKVRRIMMSMGVSDLGSAKNADLENADR